MVKAKKDFSISPNGWDTVSFKKGEEIKDPKLAARSVAKGLAEDASEQLDLVEPEPKKPATKKRGPKKTVDKKGPEIEKNTAPKILSVKVQDSVKWANKN